MIYLVLNLESYVTLAKFRTWGFTSVLNFWHFWLESWKISAICSLLPTYLKRPSYCTCGLHIKHCSQKYQSVLNKYSRDIQVFMIIRSETSSGTPAPISVPQSKLGSLIVCVNTRCIIPKPCPLRGVLWSPINNSFRFHDISYDIVSFHTITVLTEDVPKNTKGIMFSFYESSLSLRNLKMDLCTR